MRQRKAIRKTVMETCFEAKRKTDIRSCLNECGLKVHSTRNMVMTIWRAHCWWHYVSDFEQWVRQVSKNADKTAEPQSHLRLICVKIFIVRVQILQTGCTSTLFHIVYCHSGQASVEVDAFSCALKRAWWQINSSLRCCPTMVQELTFSLSLVLL